ncbi:MAG: ATP-dependent DNA helicase [Oscillospiraceae bacterium]|nr:ATP-dependent DNA helicase [Oscillospiraceae bacterium]
MELKLPVRALVEFLLRNGNIDSRFSSVDRALLGSRIHRKLQKAAGKHYKAEVSLSITQQLNDVTYTVFGRADGIITESAEVCIDEIKTIEIPLETLTSETYPVHWAQAMCYGHILCCNEKISQLTLQLTYYQIDTDEVKQFRRQFTAAALADFFVDLLQQYEKWALLTLSWQATRNASLQQLSFPFSGYRRGQREFAIAVYRCIAEQQRLFACAPTGTGKTMSTLFPALKAMGENYGEKIFYLTAKTITRQAAQEAIGILASTMPASSPLQLKSIVLTAKDKICCMQERNCTPEACPRAEGYFSRINDALYTILQNNTVFDRALIEAYAQQYCLCPYELSLDLSTWCDCIICDYNYLFDPVVHLMRFFEGRGGDYTFLIDEAHNLVERSREMYSAILDKNAFFELRKQMGKEHKKLYAALGKINTAFIALRHLCGSKKQYTQPKLPQELDTPLRDFIRYAEEWLNDNKGNALEQEMLSLYFNTKFYMRIADNYKENYTTLIYLSGSNVIVKLFCLDPCTFLDDSLKLGNAAVVFSATLNPLDYYRDLLGGRENTKILNIESPFCTANLGVYVADTISTKYINREQSCADIVKMLYTFISKRQGNYIAYFPSYAYMRLIYEAFCGAFPDIQVLLQESEMDELARETFLNRFQADTTHTLLGFCVLGGIYGEGIDLAGERLIGCAIIGVGLPQIGSERDVIRDYFNEKNGYGFDFAYRYPGMNKVLQAAGRVIRTEQDKGAVLLIDDRFTTSAYQQLFPKHWQQFKTIKNCSQLEQELDAFWQT